jgi:hypothetical protein
VPHIGVTVTLGLMVADLAVLIYFIHHTAISIQLPQVIAGIANDLSEAIEVQGHSDGGPGSGGPAQGPSSAEIAGRIEAGGRVVKAPASGYVQFIGHRNLIRLAAEADAVISLEYRPGHFIVQGHPFARVWPPEAAGLVAEALGRAHVIGPYRTLTQDVSFGIDQLVEIAIRALSPAVNDTFTALTCIDWLADNLCQIVSRWHPARYHRDEAGFIRVIAAQPEYERLVQRSFEKIRQAATAMPAVMIRQLDALALIMADTSGPGQRRVLLDQGAMIDRASERSVPEAADRADVRRRYEHLLTLDRRLAATVPDGRGALQIGEGSVRLPLGQQGRGTDEEVVRSTDDLFVLARVIKLLQDVPHRFQTGPLLVVTLHHGPRRDRRVGVVEHRLLGLGVVVPLIQRLDIHRAEFPLPDGIDLPDDEPGQLLALRHREPEFDQVNAGPHDHALEIRSLAHELEVLLVGAEAHDPLHAGPVVPGPVEHDDLTRAGQVGHVPLEVPLALLPLARLLQRDHGRAARVEVLHEAFDRPALAGGIAALEHDHDLLPGFLDPVLKLDQLDLEQVLRVLVPGPRHARVVRVVLPPGVRLTSVRIDQDRIVVVIVPHPEAGEKSEIIRIL